MRSDQGGVRRGDEKKCYLFVKIPAHILILILVLLELTLPCEMTDNKHD